MTKLKMWRMEQGLSLDEAAGKIGLSRSSLHYIESGRLVPSQGQKDRLTAFFLADAETLLRSVRSGVS